MLPASDAPLPTTAQIRGALAAGDALSRPGLGDVEQALYDHGFVVGFDWGAWQPEAIALHDEPARLATARLATRRRRLTLHVRKERVSEGHLVAVVESGHGAAVLERLRALAGG